MEAILDPWTTPARPCDAPDPQRGALWADPQGPVDFAVDVAVGDERGNFGESFLVPGDGPAVLASGGLRPWAELTLGAKVRLRNHRLAVVQRVRPMPRSGPSTDPSWARVTGKTVRTVSERTLIETQGDRIETTPDHRFFVEGKGWVPARFLSEGDRLAGQGEGRFARVRRTVTEPVAPHGVYNLEVEGLHTYRVGLGRVLVHNGGCFTEPESPPKPFGAEPTRSTEGSHQNGATNGAMAARVSSGATSPPAGRTAVPSAWPSEVRPRSLSALARRAGLDGATLQKVEAHPEMVPKAAERLRQEMRKDLSAPEREAVDLEIDGRRFVDRKHYEKPSTAWHPDIPEGTQVRPEHAYGQGVFEDWRSAARFVEEEAKKGSRLTPDLLLEIHRRAKSHDPPIKVGVFRFTSVMFEVPPNSLDLPALRANPGLQVRPPEWGTLRTFKRIFYMYPQKELQGLMSYKVSPLMDSLRKEVDEKALDVDEAIRRVEEALSESTTELRNVARSVKLDPMERAYLTGFFKGAPLTRTKEDFFKGVSAHHVETDVAAKAEALMAKAERRLAAGEDPVDVAADTQRELVTVHPFFDGNGRTSRLVMDFILRREGMAPSILHDTDRDVTSSAEAWQKEVRKGLVMPFRITQRAWEKNQTHVLEGHAREPNVLSPP